MPPRKVKKGVSASPGPDCVRIFVEETLVDAIFNENRQETVIQLCLCDGVAPKSRSRDESEERQSL